jgi:hypothetical protein
MPAWMPASWRRWPAWWRRQCSVRWRRALAQEALEQERARREREVDKDRRHQLDLLALQNDVNKAALAPARPGLGGAGRRMRRAPAATATRRAAGDRFCAPAAPPAGLTGMMQTAIDKIRELRALHEDGLLSRQEFDSRKNAILDAAYAPPAAPGRPATSTRGTEIGLMAGQEVGPPNRRYRLERLIAHGGMGQVWQATDLATHAELGHSAQVALKILPPQLTESASHAKLLVEEATRARRLAHEHIVRVYDWAQDPATSSYFIIMECLEGEDLDSLLAREGRWRWRARCAAAPVAEALDYAWERISWCTATSSRPMCSSPARGDIKLLDFGIAARARAAAAPD